MTKCKPLSILALTLALSFCSEEKTQKTVSLADSSLTSIFEQLINTSNPFEFYKDVYENFRFELKSTLITPAQQEEVAPVESIAIFENNENDESRFFKKSFDPIAEVEWLGKKDRDFIRYDDSKNFLRTSYNPEFEKWKKRMFSDIQSIFDLKELEKAEAKTEKNQWSCHETKQQKICLDSKTGLPVFGKAIKQIKTDTAISMVFSLTYGQDAIPAPEPEKKEAAPVKPKKQALPKKKKI
ncbi:MAG: hypothetical protein IT286_00060 [Proteobacteria bacterium]|nr:hypothetical protein [Pseudomonadota bacterium]